MSSDVACTFMTLALIVASSDKNVLYCFKLKTGGLSLMSKICIIRFAVENSFGSPLSSALIDMLNIAELLYEQELLKSRISKMIHGSIEIREKNNKSATKIFSYFEYKED